MAELTLEQQRALALARARARSEQQPSEPPEQPETSTFADITETMGRGMLRGIPVAGPALERGVERLESMFTDQPLEQIQARGEQLREERPLLDLGSEFAGGMGVMGRVIGMAPKVFGAAGTFAQRLFAGTVSGTVLGGADVAARGGDPVTGAAFGAAGGAGGVLIGGALGRLFAKRQATPTAQALRDQAGPLFDRARQVGVVVKPGVYRAAIDDLATVLQREGLDPTLHPKATRALVRLQAAKEAGEVSFEDLHTLRRVVGAAAGSIEKDERRVASIMVDKLDDFMDALGAADVLAGDPQAAQAIVKEARQLWSRAAKAEIIEDAIEKAERMISGGRQSPAVAFATQFRGILNNKRIARKFTPAQRKAIDAVATEKLLPKMLERIGGLRGTIVGVAAGAGIELTTGLPFASGGGAVVAGGLGEAGRRGAATGARQAAETVRGMAATDLARIMTPSARARAFGSAVGIAGGLEAGRP